MVERQDDFAWLLVAARRSQRLTQEELAEASGLSVRAIRDMERGRVRSPHRRTLTILADTLGLPAADRDRFLRSARAGRRLPAPAGHLAPPAGSTATSFSPDLESATGHVGVQHVEQDRPSVPIPGELPAAVSDLAGRDRELAGLRAVAAEVAGGHRSTASLVSLSGPPGVGKTTLAVSAGQQISDGFPDGQLFVDLRATSDGAREPGEVLAEFLRSLGVADGRLPSSMTERAGMYRTITRSQRLLVVLDNAGDESQVRPLLPAGRHCLVLVTSRRPMTGLNSAHRIRLGTLTPRAAHSMLTSILGSDRTAREATDAERLVHLCGQLPLALRIVGNRLASRPDLPLARMVDQVEDQRHRLAALTAGDLSVRATFQVSYEQLRAPAQDLFRLASLVPGDDFDVDLAAAVAGAAAAETHQLLEEIVDAGLLLAGPERYHYHDLIRLYAQECREQFDPPHRVAEARHRMVAWLLDRTTWAGTSFTPRPGTPEDPGICDDAEAGAWLARESANWLGALREAVGQCWYDLAVPAIVALHWYSDAAPHRHPWDEVFALGVDAARASCQAVQEAVLLNFHGWALAFCRQRDDEALRAHSAALALARDLGEGREHAWALAYLGNIHVRNGRPQQALPACREAVGRFRALGYGPGEHYALAGLGRSLCALERYPEALGIHRRVLSYYRHQSGLTRAGAAVAAATTLLSVGQAHGGLRRWQEAADAYAESLDLFAGGEVWRGEATAALHLGQALSRLEQRDDARKALLLAVERFGQLGDAWNQAQTRHALARQETGRHARELREQALDDCLRAGTAAARALAQTIRTELSAD